MDMAMPNEIIFIPPESPEDRGRRLVQIETLIDQKLETMGRAIVDIGYALIEAKELLGHGEWLPWLTGTSKTKPWHFSERTAQNLMAVARAFDHEIHEFRNVHATALYMLATADEVAIQEAIYLVNNTDTVLDKEEAEIIRYAPAPIKDRYRSRELNKEQAVGLTKASRVIKSEQMQGLINDMSDGQAAIMLDRLALAGDDVVTVMETTGYFQSSNVVIPVHEVTARHVQSYIIDKERIEGDTDAEYEPVIYRRALKVVRDGNDTVVVLNQDDIDEGDEVYVTIEIRKR